MATDWDEPTKRRARLGFGRAEKVTWAVMHLTLKLFPTMMIKKIPNRQTVAAEIDQQNCEVQGKGEFGQSSSKSEEEVGTKEESCNAEPVKTPEGRSASLAARS